MPKAILRSVALAAFLIAPLGVGRAWATSAISGISLETYPSSLRFVVETAAPVKVDCQDLIDQHGLFYVDLYDVHCKILRPFVQRDDLFLRAYQFVGYPQQHVLRIIFWPQPGVRFRLAKGESPARLIVELVRESPAVASSNPPPSAQSQSPAASPPPPPPATSKGRWKVIIDPGHGGEDLGARGKVQGKRVNEKDVVLQIAMQLAGMIKKAGNMDCYLTRTDDQRIGLYERVKMAEQVAESGDGQCLFISIHCNSARNRKARGFEIYYLNETSGAAAREIERLENNPKYRDELKGDSLLWNLFRSLEQDKLDERKRQSAKMCAYITEAFKKSPYYKQYNRGYKNANLAVLKNFLMPAALAEIGFLSNKEECPNLVNPDFQYNIAAMLFNGINYYFAAQDESFPGQLYPLR